MADELRCIHCGYQQTEHENKHFVEGYAEASEKEIRTHKACIKNGWPCNKFTPDKKKRFARRNSTRSMSICSVVKEGFH